MKTVRKRREIPFFPYYVYASDLSLKDTDSTHDKHPVAIFGCASESQATELADQLSKRHDYGHVRVKPKVAVFTPCSHCYHFQAYQGAL